MGGFIYGLAVALLIFEGIITQCEGTGGAAGAEGSTSSNQGAGVPTINSQGESMQFQPIKSVISIHVEFKGEIDSGFYVSYEHENGDVKLTFANYNEIERFLKNYGNHVEKIHIAIKSSHYEPQILNIFKKCENNLEELRISSYFNDVKFWKALSNDNKFPKMKNLEVNAWITQKNFKLDPIFPKLEYLTLDGIVTDKDCLANMDHLKELTLKTTSIPEEKLESIFQKSNGITMIELREPEMGKTMQSIARHLKDLKELKVSLPGENFLLRKEGDPICEFPKVEKFTIFAGEIHKLCEIGKLSFKMPKLRELTLYGNSFNKRFVKFIEHFETLETLRLDKNFDNEFFQIVRQTWTYSKETRIRNFDYLEFKKSAKK